MAKYFAILTNLGAGKLANAAALGTELEITHIAVGDGGGVSAPEPTPDPAMTDLLGEKRRAAINSLSIDPLNPNQIIVEQVIPETDGGFWIREIGLFDKAGTMIAYSNCAGSYKPQLQEGSGRALVIRMILIVSSTEAVSLKIDPSVVLATRKYVDDKIIEVKTYTDKAMAEHLGKADPHKQYAKGADVDTALKALEEKVKINARPVLHRDWASCRAAIPVGQAPADGQIIENGRALYPAAWAAIQAGLVPVCSEADWLANPSKRGCYTTGDGKTNFRVPDYNGKRVDSLAAVVFRGDGKNAAPAGDVQGDTIRDVIASVGTNNGWGFSVVAGAAELGVDRRQSRFATESNESPNGCASAFTIKASNSVPTGPENRMVNVAGVWTIHMFGAVMNSGSVDAAAIATAIAGLSARVSTLESAFNARKLTCLVNAVGTGAPHETVVAQIPSTISNNTRYVIPNPFGNDTPVICIVELLFNGRWADPGWENVSSGAAYGVCAGYVQGSGIVIQTAKNYVIGPATDLGGLGGGAGAATSAPCRVFVRKMEG